MTVGRVSFLGLGKMGGAMCRRLRDQGVPLAVWNRSVEKCRAFADEEPGADTVVCETAEGAVLGGDGLVVMVLDSTESTLGVLRGLPLEGKTVVNLASGNPDEGREVAGVVAAAKAQYIDGAYCGPPAKARSGAGVLFLSADERCVVDRWADELGHLGNVQFAGKVGASRALDYAVVDLVMANFLSYLSNLEMLEREGVDLKQVFACAGARLATVPAALEMYTGRMADRSDAAYAANPTVTLATWENFFASRLPYMASRGIPTAVPDFVLSLVRKAAEGGHSGDDMSRLQELVRYGC